MSAKLMKHVEFYECEICGNVMVKLVDGGVTPQCCGSSMEMMKVKKGDSGKEKHTPVVLINEERVTVNVGEIAHPMEEDHFIGFAVLENGCGFDVKELKTKGYPVAQFLLNEDETAGRVYAWCNQHGLWEAERKEI
ncbi:MAG: desulfoferrodoxin [Firmicutes bacterium]|nr:desulfoferrodoxin [Bacillota bacterium]